jgi:hypothetical protein
MQAPRTLLILLLIFSFLIPISGVVAQAAISNPTASYEFGESIRFTANLQSDQPVQGGLIYIQEKGSPAIIVKSAGLTSLDGSNYQLEYLFDLNENPVRAFSNLEYRFEATLLSGEKVSGPAQHIHYLDDRFEWQNKPSDFFRLYWYAGDEAFAQNALDVATTGLKRIQAILSLADPDEIDLYVYPNSLDMQETLLLAGRSWVAGHADPDLGVIVVTLPPDPEQRYLSEQRIPHELMHVMLYQSLGASYSNLPSWLNEGLASIAELYPNPDYQALLENAYQQGDLIPFTNLCSSFPQDASGALLAYAQSASLLSYLRSTVGSEGLQALIYAYANDSDCEQGVQNVLGASLTELETQWRSSTFDEKPSGEGIRNLLPWLALLAAVLLAPLFLFLAWLRIRPAPQK